MMTTQFMMRTFFYVILKRIRLLIHLSSVYLGLAGLVILFAVVILPSAQIQAKKIYAAIVSSFDDAPLSQLSTGIVAYEDMPEEVAQMVAEGMPAQATFFTKLLNQEYIMYFEDVPKQQLVALRNSLVKTYKIAPEVANAIMGLAFRQAKEYDLDPLLILAVIAIESRYNPFVQSSVGAQGLMQVMPNVHKDKFVKYTGGRKSALNPETNIEVGTQILRDCVRRRRTVDLALACYVGASVPSRDGGYARKVQAERRRLALNSGMPLRKNLGKD